MEKPIKTLEQLAEEEYGFSHMEEESYTPKKKSNKEDNTIYTSYLETEHTIVEQIATHATDATSKKDSQFIIYNKDSGSISVQKSYEYNNKLFVPIVDDLVDRGSILLPSKVENYGSTEELVNEISEFLNKYFKVNSFYGNFFPYLILFYWVYEKFPFIPYVHFMGRTGTGKSTAMEVLGSICYKPIDASGAISISSIFRIADLWHGTLLLDEFNAGGENYNEMLSLLKSGVSNKVVLRVEGERKREVKAYIVKSPKIFTSEKPITDAGLRSRVLEIKMDKNKEKVPLYRQRSFLTKAEELRNKLLLWRLHNLDKIDLSKIEYGFEELSSFDGRVQQVITPIYYLANDDVRKKIIEFAKEQQEETVRERRESLDGVAFTTIYEKHQDGLNISLSDVCEAVNKGNPHPITERKLANIIRKILKFDVQRMGHENISTVIINDELFKEHCEYYGLKLLSEFNVAQVASVADEANMEKVFSEIIKENA